MWLISPGAWEKTHLAKYCKKSGLPNNAKPFLRACKNISPPAEEKINTYRFVSCDNLTRTARGVRILLALVAKLRNKMFCYSWSFPHSQESLGAVCNLWCEQAWFWFHDVSNCKLCCAHRVRVRKVNLGCVCTRSLKGWLCPQLADVTLLVCQLGHLPFMAAQFPAMEFYEVYQQRLKRRNIKSKRKP